MKAAIIDEHGSADRLRLADIAAPVAGPGQLVVRVQAAGLNPADHKHRSGMFKDMIPYRFPYVGGYDVAGVVDSLGEGVTAFRPGDRVFAMLEATGAGGYAELAAVDAGNCALIPDGMTFEQAAVIPCAALTGHQMVVEALAPAAGDCVLVIGATGSVGRFALAAAKQAGARVVAAVRSAYRDEALALGADSAIAIAGEGWSAPPFDGVIDTVGGPDAAALAAMVKPGGKIVTVATDPMDAQILPTAPVMWFVRQDGTMLAEIGASVATGKVPLPIAASFPLDDARKAHEMLERGGLGGAKIVLKVAAD